MRDVRGYFVKHRSGSLLLLLLLISLMFMGATSEANFIRPKQVGNAVFSVIQRGFAGIGSFFDKFVSSIGELRRLRPRYEELQNELIQFRRDEREIIQLRQENAQLRTLLELSVSLTYKHIPAQVIGNDPSSFFSTLVIDRGRVHGMKVDMPVVAFQDGFQGLVGKIVAVGPISSQVLPVFDSTCFVPARLQNSRFAGLVQGSGSRFSFLKMTYVPKSAQDLIAIGDLVTTSGFSTIYPKDIYVGRVRSISAKSWEASLTLDIEPTVDFSRIEYVFVLDFDLESEE